MPEDQSPAPQNRPDQPETIAIDDAGRPLNTKPKSRWHWHHFSRRTKILVSAVILAVILGIGAFIFLGDSALAPGGSQKSAKTTVPSPLTGIEVKPELAARPVTGIMIENSQDARPQSGLRDAGVVFEAIAEGGITRFLTLFQEATPQYIGPVRSLRPYYIDWANGFDAAIAHVGGAPKALKQIRNGGKDLDQFFNAGAYWRISSRPAPHNVYTSFKNLDKLNRQKGYKHSKFTSWPRKAESPRQVPKASTIKIGISGPEFNIIYTYNKDGNNYTRKEGGVAHLSTSSANPKSAKVIRPKVVIAMVVPFGLDRDGHHSDYDTLGRGFAYIFQDGGANKVTWVKKDRTSQIKFLDAEGNPVALNAGQTWVTVIDSKGDVGYSSK